MLKTLLLGLFIFRTTQSQQLFTYDDIRCLESNNSMYYSGRCYPLLEQGPCENGYWLILQSATIQDTASLEAACAPCNCCKESIRKVYWSEDGQCHRSNDPSVCRPGNRLINDFDGTGICACKDGFMRVRGTNKDHQTCYPLYNRPPSCKQNEYLVASGEPGWGHCTRNPCGVDGAALWPPNGQCYMLGTPGPCSEPDQLFRVSPVDGQPQCLSPSFSAFNKIPQRCGNTCVLEVGQNSGGSAPAISSKLQAFLKRKRIQVPPAENGPQTDIWAWKD